MSDPIPENIGSAFTKKIGPLPGWAWVVIVVGGAYAVYFYKKKTGTATPVNNSAGVTVDPNAGAFPTVGGGAVTSATGNGSVTQPQGNVISTNAQWGRLVVQNAVAGGTDAALASNAVSSYLNGGSLSPSQQGVITAGISALGVPPEGVVPVHTSSANAAYTVVSGDSLTSIAQAFYGDSSRWKDIFAANQKLLGGDPQGGLHHGQKLTLPGQGLLSTPQAVNQNEGVPAGHKYTIQYGDTGIGLAKRFYGDGTQWSRIYNANRSLIPNPNVLVAGITITIP